MITQADLEEFFYWHRPWTDIYEHTHCYCDKYSDRKAGGRQIESSWEEHVANEFQVAFDVSTLTARVP